MSAVAELARFELARLRVVRSRARSRLEQRFQAALDAERWELAWILFDHLWPGVWGEDGNT